MSSPINFRVVIGTLSVQRESAFNGRPKQLVSKRMKRKNKKKIESRTWTLFKTCGKSLAKRKKMKKKEIKKKYWNIVVTVVKSTPRH